MISLYAFIIDQNVDNVQQEINRFSFHDFDHVTQSTAGDKVAEGAT